MKKVFKGEELSVKRGDNIRYSEAYEVNFNIKDGGFWKPMSLMYFTASKSSHKAVQGRWSNDFKNSKVKLVSIIYQ